jgi:hypothetical protein
MAAFCACCGAEITLKAEACPICGTPRHGMLPPDLLSALLSASDIDTQTSQGDILHGDQAHKGRDTVESE